MYVEYFIAIILWDISSDKNDMTPTKITTLRGHTHCINALALSIKHNRLFSGSVDGSVYVWDICEANLKKRKPNRITALITAHGDVIRALVTAGNTLFSASSDSDTGIIVWDISKKIPLLLDTLTDHVDGARGLALSPSGDRLYSCSMDDSIIAWDITDHAQPRNVIRMKDSSKGASALLCYSYEETADTPLKAVANDHACTVQDVCKGNSSSSSECKQNPQ